MDNFLKKTASGVSSPSHKHRSSFLYKCLHLFTWIIVSLALLAGLFLLVSDVFVSWLPHMPISAAPLLLIGVAYLAFQALIRAPLLDLFKALIVSSAFILWGIDQLLPAGRFATILGDIVIVLYVIDLGWMMIDRLRQQWRDYQTQPRKPLAENNVSSFLHKSDLPLLHPAPSGQRADISPCCVELSKGNAPSFKRYHLDSLSCTCASPLAPFQSSPCCRAMSGTSRSS